jgi:hypothetical protein
VAGSPSNNGLTPWSGTASPTAATAELGIPARSLHLAEAAGATTDVVSVITAGTEGRRGHVRVAGRRMAERLVDESSSASTSSTARSSWKRLLINTAQSRIDTPSPGREQRKQDMQSVPDCGRLAAPPTGAAG